MLKKLFCIGALGLALNKLSYAYLLKSLPPKPCPLLGEGPILTLSHNPLSKSWLCPLKTQSLSLLPLFKHYHLHDIFLNNSESPSIFRPRAYHENLNLKLDSLGLSVT